MKIRAVALVAAVILGIAAFPSVAAAAPVPSVIATTAHPIGVVEDSAGNVWIADGTNATSSLRGLVVVPAATGTLFGFSVTADAQQTLIPRSSFDGDPRGVAIDGLGDVYVSDTGGSVWVLTSSNRTVFGTAVTADTFTRIASGTNLRGGLAFDSAGNLFGVNQTRNIVAVLPTSSGTLFGVNVTANAASTVVTYGGGWFWDLAIDGSDNVYVTDGWGNEGVFVLPKTTTTLYGQSVTADSFEELTVWATDASRPAGIDIDGSGNMFVTYWNNLIAMVAPSATSYFGQEVPALTATRLTYTVGYGDQGLAVGAAGSLISGALTATYRLVDFASYTVTFDANAADTSGTMTPQTDSSAASLTTNAFTRTGYTFAGWATTPTGAIAYADGATYPFTSSATLYARWAAPGEEIPVVVRTPPADVFQSVGIAADADCSDVDGPDHNWAGTTNGGWGKSWAQWPNDGTGGFVCNRILRYSVETERWFTVMQ